MASTLRTAADERSSETAPRDRTQAVARAFLWLSVAVLSLAAVGLATVVVVQLAPHVAPAGGGG